MSSTAPPVSIAPDALPVAAGVAAAGVAAAVTPPALRCANCGAPVAGRYCSACGQRREPPVHSLWHFAQLATEDLTHADSRLWRTLAALLFKPGYLTRDFLAGRRARYLPPVRLYLVLSVVFFVWASATHTKLQVLQVSVPERGAPPAAITPLEDEQSPFTPARPGESGEQRAVRICHERLSPGPWEGWAGRLEPAMRNACVRMVEDNGRSLQESFLHNLPRAMFLFLPLLAGAMMLMYWWPQRYYVEHLLLFVHNHAFVFLIVMLAWGVGALLPVAARWVDRAVFLYILWYLYRSMRVAYGQGRGLTVVKLVLLCFFYLVCGSVML